MRPDRSRLDGALNSSKISSTRRRKEIQRKPDQAAIDRFDGNWEDPKTLEKEEIRKKALVMTKGIGEEGVS